MGKGTKEKGDKGKKLDLRKTGRGEALIGFNVRRSHGSSVPSGG